MHSRPLDLNAQDAQKFLQLQFSNHADIYIPDSSFDALDSFRMDYLSQLGYQGVVYINQHEPFAIWYVAGKFNIFCFD